MIGKQVTWAGSTSTIEDVIPMQITPAVTLYSKLPDWLYKLTLEYSFVEDLVHWLCTKVEIQKASEDQLLLLEDGRMVRLSWLESAQIKGGPQ